MSTTPTFTAPVMVRECATIRTNPPKYALAEMKQLYQGIKWSTMGVQLNGNSGTASMNHMKYDITNVAAEKHHSKMDVYITNPLDSFVFTSKDVTDSTGAVTMIAKDLQLTVHKGDNIVVVIVGLLPNTMYILYVDENMDIYCAPV